MKKPFVWFWIFFDVFAMLWAGSTRRWSWSCMEFVLLFSVETWWLVMVRLRMGLLTEGVQVVHSNGCSCFCSWSCSQCWLCWRVWAGINGKWRLQDVFLYIIFGVSPLKFQLRVFYGYMKERDLLDSNDVKFPKFSKAKHRILCFELKQLYVAITRTRQRLWICENVDFSKPMFDYWKKLGLFQVRQLDESLVHTMQVTSSKEEWSSRGTKLLDEGSFEMATMCL